jgi:hypothetical protein
MRSPLHEATVVSNGLDLGSARGDADALYLGIQPDLIGRSDRMSRMTYAIAAAVLTAVCLGVVAYAQQPAPPPFATTK